MKYESKATLALVNFNGEWGNKAARLEKMMGQVRVAARQGADIIVFPELCLSGYQCDEEGSRELKPCKMHEEAAETVPGPSSEEMAKLAKELGVYIIYGLPERDKTDPKIRYIAAAVVAPEGILGTYRKLHLAPNPKIPTLYPLLETICFKPGTEIPVWETKFGPIGILICFDSTFFPELARIMAFKGARLIINVSASPSSPGKLEFFTRQTGARASENFIYYGVTNLAGKDRALSFHGNSTIAGPTGSKFTTILAQAGEAEEIISASLNFDLVDFWNNEMIDWKAAHQTQLIGEEFLKIAKAKAAKK